MKNLKIAYRNLQKNRTVSVINLSGLTLGMVISILLLSYVRQERNTDKFIADYDNIYMFTIDNNDYFPRPLVYYYRDKMPGTPITYFTEDWAGQVFLSDEDGKSYKVNHLLNTDSAFFNVFQFETVAGTTQNALDVTSKIVLKESLAKKIFGEQNPVGKTVRLSTSYFSGEPLEVSAVLKDFTENTSWQFDAVISVYLNDKMLSWYKENADRWGARNYTAFCRIPSNTNPESLQSLLSILSDNPELVENLSNEKELHLSVRPYSQLYLHSTQPRDIKHGNPQTLNVLELIALLILLMACVNYVNLVSAQRQKRNKSVAIVKIHGSQKWGVVRIFAVEAAMLLLTALALCIIVMPFALQFFNELMETHYSLSAFVSPENILMMFAILITIFLITGLLPGLIFSRHKALWMIKPINGNKKKGIFRNALPILQFSIAIALISCLFIIKKQNDMMLAQNPGYEREQVIYAATNSDMLKQSQALVNDLKTIPGISDITFADADFIDVKQNWGVNLVYDGEERYISFNKIGVTPNFFDFFGIKLIEGQHFSKSEANFDETIFNETAVRQFGITDIEKATMNGYRKIIGVVRDFNLKSAHFPIAPVGFFCNGESAEYIYIKTHTQNYKELKTLIAQIEQRWNRLSPNIPFEYRFLDEEWENRYKKELQFQKLLTHAGWISIFIACLGLFGLSIFITEQRTKEIGIRKVNGATIFEMVLMLNKNVLVWLAVAFAIATPVAYYAMTRWLENFAYKIALSWWIFVAAGLVSLFVALCTVSWQSWRAASKNPVEALRYE